MTLLLPRLPPVAADKMLDDFFRCDPPDWQGFVSHKLPEAIRYAATGGARISPSSLDKIRNEILTIAQDCGFGNTGAQKDHATFDTDAASWLADCSDISPGEALRDDVWSFFCIVMFPDVAYWRFGAARERYLGGVRNTLQRLWLRACAVDRGELVDDRWGLLRELTEDAFVQIVERPSIGSDTTLARGIAEAWVRAASRYGRGRMEAVMRQAVLRIRITNEVRSLATLDSRELAETLDRYFDTAASAGT